MRIKKLLALVSLTVVALLLFASCAPDSIADSYTPKTEKSLSSEFQPKPPKFG
ncbi:hypothetical protein [Spongiivirga citrea]|uniref:Quinol oxidase subunit 4 n=1 Tax=Spongiivirga citrea TaxID=1481457 RepID=A0A6M0CR55_9FLAO|nr:hypothetical protein [Spongiivirga citrea]NER16430.1 hypothetical protein [Spongiivirga citrea]